MPPSQHMVVLSIGSDARDTTAWPQAGHFRVQLGASASRAEDAPAWPAAPIMHCPGRASLRCCDDGPGTPLVAVELSLAPLPNIPHPGWFTGIVACVALQCTAEPLWGTVCTAQVVARCEDAPPRLVLFVQPDAPCAALAAEFVPGADCGPAVPCDLSLRAERPQSWGAVLECAAPVGGAVRAVRLDPRVALADVLPVAGQPLWRLVVCPAIPGNPAGTNAAAGCAAAVTGWLCLQCRRSCTSCHARCQSCDAPPPPPHCPAPPPPHCPAQDADGAVWLAVADPGFPAGFAAAGGLRFELWRGTSAAAAATLLGSAPSLSSSSAVMPLGAVAHAQADAPPESAVSLSGVARAFRPVRDAQCAVRLRDVYVPCCPRLLGGGRGCVADLPFVWVQVRPFGFAVPSEPLVTTTPIDTTNWLTFVVPIHAQHGGRVAQMVQGPYDVQQCVCRSPWPSVTVRVLGPTGQVLAFCPSLPGAYAEAGPDPLGQLRLTLEVTFTEADPRSLRGGAH